MITGTLDEPGLIARWSLCAVLAVAFQTGVIWKLSIVGARPEVPLLLAVTSGVVVGERLFDGLWIGLLFDLVAGPMIGLSAFSYGVAGYAAGAVDDVLITDSPIVKAFHIAGASALAIVIQALVGEVFGQPYSDGWRFLWVAALVAVFHLPLGLPAMRVVEWAEPEDR